MLQTSPSPACPPSPAFPQTDALRRVLTASGDGSSAADLLFLERWEMDPLPGAAAALRIGQIRRANPALAAAIRAEVESSRKLHFSRIAG